MQTKRSGRCRQSEVAGADETKWPVQTVYKSSESIGHQIVVYHKRSATNWSTTEDLNAIKTYAAKKKAGSNKGMGLLGAGAKDGAWWRTGRKWNIGCTLQGDNLGAQPGSRVVV